VLGVGEGEVAVRKRERVGTLARVLPRLDGVLGLVVVEETTEQIGGVGVLRVVSHRPMED